jgi:hypothetical protein
MAVDEGQKQKRTPFSARLPQSSLDEVLPIVQALSDLGVPSTPHVLAGQMGTSYATNARFRTRLGAAGYYGFIRKEGDKRALTERGEALLGDQAAAEQARREAVMATTFGPVIHSLRGRPVSDNTISLRLQADYGAPEASAPSIAKALVDSATRAGLISDDRFDAAAIESAASAMPASDEVPQPKQRTKERASKTTTPPKKDQQQQQQQAQTKEQNGKTVEEEARPFVPGVQVVVKIDASSLTPQQIAELVRALQAPPHS